MTTVFCLSFSEFDDFQFDSMPSAIVLIVSKIISVCGYSLIENKLDTYGMFIQSI